jgi:hypothetical protein
VVAVRVADDDRARVPFALVAVLLLLGSATYAATMRGRAPGGADPDPEAAVERVESATRTLLVRAVDRAARDAARNPLTDPANTTYGEVVDGPRPFRTYLRARLYLAARRSLAGGTQTVDDVRASASLPAVGNATEFRRAIGRVNLTGNGTTLEVEFEGVRFEARRDGDTLWRANRSVAVAVENPVLRLHERTESFQRRLNGHRTTLRFSALMYAVAWTRGYLQRGGFPIENVVANRHVEVMTNAVALATQRSTFGRSDPDGREALRRAFLQVGLRDVIAPALGTSTDGWLGVVLGDRPSPLDTASPVAGPVPSLAVPDLPAPSPEDEMTVGVNGTADVAFARLLRGDGGPAFLDVVNDTYDARATVVSAVERTHEGTAPPPTPPGPDWTLANATETVDRTARDGSASLPGVPDGWHAHDAYERRVVVHHRVTRRWERGDEATTTNVTYEDRYRVGLRVVDDHAPARYAPDDPIATVHERGGPLDGPNLLWTPGNATRRLIEERGGADAVARRVVAGTRDGDGIVLPGERPAGLSDWAYRDVARLRERVRNVTANVTRGGLATTVNAPRRLADAIQRNRSALLDAPDVYRSVADKVRVEARGAYLDRVLAVLDRRAEEVETAKGGVRRRLADEDVSSEAPAELLRERAFDPGPPGGSNLTVDGGPPYLTLASVGHRRISAVEPGRGFHPLVAENVNLFTIPYDDAVGAATDGGGSTGADPEGLRSVALTLGAANDLVGPDSNASVRATRAAVRDDLSGAVSSLGERLADPVARVTALNRSRRLATVESGLSRYGSTAARALALANGSAAAAVTAAVDDRTNLTPVAADWLRTRLRLVLAEGLPEGGPSPAAGPASKLSRAVGRLSHRATTNYVGNRVSAVKDRYVGDLTERLRRRWRDKYDDVLSGSGENDPASVAAGLPVLPSPPGYYFTMNVWVVNVGGEYARFAVRAPGGGPAGGSVAYVRDGRNVSLDVDGDGGDETLGSAGRVSFSTRTVVMVVVPPGPPGVGDTNGRMFERSAGWCTAGPVGANESATC